MEVVVKRRGGFGWMLVGQGCYIRGKNKDGLYLCDGLCLYINMMADIICWIMRPFWRSGYFKEKYEN